MMKNIFNKSKIKQQQQQQRQSEVNIQQHKKTEFPPFLIYLFLATMAMKT
jgi:hypothetical protein